MEYSIFKEAKPIFIQSDTKESTVSCGYRADFFAGEEKEVFKLNITGRSYYRLYINGKTVMHGPARCAHGYLRVDEINLTPYVKAGNNTVAIAQISYGKPFGEYSNEITLEPGVLCFEILNGEGQVAVYSSENTPALRLKERRQTCERRSHCREAVEIYDIDETHNIWINCDIDDIKGRAIEVQKDYILLPRRMALPDFKIVGEASLIDFGGYEFKGEHKPNFYEERMADDLRKSTDWLLKETSEIREVSGGRNVKFLNDGVNVFAKDNTFLSFDIGESYVGFINFKITTDNDIRLDVLGTELENEDGSVFFEFNMDHRFYIKKGTYELTTFDAGIARKIKFYIKGDANVTISGVSMLNFTTPDTKNGSFISSNGTLNSLYNAARKTLILNTLDIFMDCPDRERGGWLCDSFWTARAAAAMLGNQDVEKAFIENFLLTDSKKYYHNFFPSVYPGNEDYPAHTISTWSMWLLAQIAEFVKRTGDREFVREHEKRIDEFIEGTMALVGNSGLIENLPIVFVDWSHANDEANVHPINIPANALMAYALISYGEVMERPELVLKGNLLKDKLKAAIDEVKDNKTIPDGLLYCDGKFKESGIKTEAGMYTSLWAGVLGYDTGFGENSKIIQNVVKTMGPDPQFAEDPRIGRSGLFIGLCVRLDLLSKLGQKDIMLKDMKAIYLPEIEEGPGTLWENEILDTSSRCHGFGAHAGYLITADILGLGLPDEINKKIVISPYPSSLRWAKGTMNTKNGAISLSYTFVDGRFELNASVPKCYEVELKLPPIVRGLDAENISINIEKV